MIEVYPNLFVGSGDDLIHIDDGRGSVKDGWFVISAAKDPWHREALGYKTAGAPKDSPEYLMVARDRRLILNLVDAPDPAYIRDEIVTTTIEMIDASLAGGLKVLVHCNQGQSRAPALALLWLRWGELSKAAPFLRRLSYDDACAAFREVYPSFAPAAGVDGYARAHWESQ